MTNGCLFGQRQNRQETQQLQYLKGRLRLYQTNRRKMAYRHSGYPGGLRSRTLGEELEKHADRVVEKAIIGMLPHNKLSRQIQKKLKVYVGSDHPHVAQQPIPFGIKQVAQ